MWADPVYAAYHRLNGNGEMTGLPWIEEVGLLHSPIGITNTHSVGVVRDALVEIEVAELPRRRGLGAAGRGRDLGRHPQRRRRLPRDRRARQGGATPRAAAGPVAEGSVGGGTGMICHDFKGGIGTASRTAGDDWTVGVLVQANHGRRERFRGQRRAGRAGDRRTTSCPAPTRPPPPGSGSIIGIVATDAPLLPLQCRRLAQRASFGVARTGGVGENNSGDLFLAFATGNRGMHRIGDDAPRSPRSARWPTTR